jgi:hypothetical protein
MTDNFMLEKIIAMRMRRDELMPVTTGIEKVYEIIGDEFFEDPKTVSYKVNLNGYYRKFEKQVDVEEKKRKLQRGNNPTCVMQSK